VSGARTVVVTGFEPFGSHPVNPSAEVAKAMDGRRFADAVVTSLVLPVDRREAFARLAPVLAAEPDAIVELGLAEGRARVALERVAVNVMDFSIPDNAGYRATDEPCDPDGPAAYLATLPLRAILSVLVSDGVPAYISSTAGLYLCNQTLYRTLHAIAVGHLRTLAGFVHLPLLPSMVATSGLEQPSMDLPLMVRAVETVLRVVARPARSGRPGQPGTADRH
jgi:pyroglutamyl-peptidase